MTTEERLQQVDFSQFSKVKDSLLLRLKLRRRAIIEEMSLEELDQVTAAGNSSLQVFDEKKKIRTILPEYGGIFLDICAERL